MAINKINRETIAFLESLAGTPFTLGSLLLAIREGEGSAQVEFAKKLGISRQNLCHIEHERRAVSPKMAARFAKILGYSEKQFIKLSLQNTLNKDCLGFFVDIKESNE